MRIVTHADIDVVMLAGRWTITSAPASPSSIAAAKHGVSLLAAAPHNSGWLARGWPTDDATLNYTAAPSELVEGARNHAATARAAGRTLPEFPLQFPLRHPAVALSRRYRTPTEATRNPRPHRHPDPGPLRSDIDRIDQD
jgi:D-threo-aldose 1-dehydrogenase